MEVEKIVSFIENSFLSSILKNENVTDISYNGEYIFYLDNNKGRQQSNVQIDFLAAKDFVRQIANLCEKQFSYQNPILDVSAGRYRVNAVHQSIGRKNNEEALTFAIRIGSVKNKINIKSGFLTKEIAELLDVLTLSHASIVIGGLTGSGKTELQKYLITRMETNARLVIIDNVLELDNIPHQQVLDINSWQADDSNMISSIQHLVRNALRSNPDWLIVAEARGAEMIEILNSSLTGHPIITTLHAMDVKSMPTRMARMVMMNDKKMNYQDVLNDISYNMRFFIYLKRTVDEKGNVHRFISEIGYLNKNKMTLIYEIAKGKPKYRHIPSSGLKMLNIPKERTLFQECFGEIK